MTIPGFTAEVSIYQSTATYSTRTGVFAIGGGLVEASAVMSRLAVGRPGGGSGGIGGGLGFFCEAGCAVAYGLCLTGCAASGPLALPCVATCTLLYDECQKGCGGGVTMF
jgi:hypothetical protein